MSFLLSNGYNCGGLEGDIERDRILLYLLLTSVVSISKSLQVGGGTLFTTEIGQKGREDQN